MDYGRQFPGVTETILVVDDNEINRALLNAIFSDSYRIEEAETARRPWTCFWTTGRRSAPYCWT